MLKIKRFEGPVGGRSCVWFSNGNVGSFHPRFGPALDRAFVFYERHVSRYLATRWGGSSSPELEATFTERRAIDPCGQSQQASHLRLVAPPCCKAGKLRPTTCLSISNRPDVGLKGVHRSQRWPAWPKHRRRFTAALPYNQQECGHLVRSAGDFGDESETVASVQRQLRMNRESPQARGPRLSQPTAWFRVLTPVGENVSSPGRGFDQKASC